MPSRSRRGRKRVGKQKALAVGTAEQLEEFELALPLDTLGDDVDARMHAEFEGRLQDSPVAENDLEISGRDHLSVGMAPAQQNLETGQSAIFKVRLRLLEQLELPVRQGPGRCCLSS